MKIIDAHMHYSKIASFRDCADLTSGVEYSERGYLAEAAACGITRSICMGLSETPQGEFPDNGARTPMLADLSDILPPEIALCIGINPHTLTKDAIDEMEAIMSADAPGAQHAGPSGMNGAAHGMQPAGPSGMNGAAQNIRLTRPTSICRAKIAGIKIYAGYYHFDVNDPVYAPAYDFAEKHGLAVAIHSGDTYSERGKLAYAQPLSIDNLAVGRPDMRIVICHMGAPWIYDGCEVAGKNRNVYLDLSGLHVGNAAYFSARIQNPLLINRYKQALTVMDAYDKVLFGTDWPLAPMASYIDFCKELVPPESYDMVFYENAVRVFNLQET